MNHLVVRDEREISVDQAADRLSYLVLSLGCWRSWRTGASRAVRRPGISWASSSWAVWSAPRTGSRNERSPVAGGWCWS